MSTSGENSSTAVWAAFRDRMPVSREWAYFDHAAVSPLPEPAADAIIDWAVRMASEGTASYPDWLVRLDGLRNAAAAMIGADVEEIALVANTTAGINFVSEGFPWKEGDNIVTRDDEFPSNLYPWMHLADRGVEVRRVKTEPDGRLDPARLAEACDDRTRMISISWVAYSNGWRHDLGQIAEIAKSRRAYFFLDAIQGLGVFPLNVRDIPIDFLSADGHKWMMGPEGAGVFYCRRELLDMLRPIAIGWHSVVGARDFHIVDLTFKPTAQRYEGGTHNMGGLLGLAESVKLLTETGPEANGRRLIEITDLACEKLRTAGAEIVTNREHDRHKSGIVTFTLPGKDPVAFRERCLEQKIMLSCRTGRLRISPHVYNNEADIDRLVELVGQAS